MGQFMGEYAFDLRPGHQVQKALGNRNSRVFRVPAGGKGVGLILGDDIDLGHGQLGPVCQGLDDGIEFRSLAWGDWLGPVHFQDHLIRIPVAEKIHTAGKNQGNDQALPASQKLSDEHDKGCH